MSQVRTVSDTKRDFYTHHTRPINSIFRRVVEELLVEMHLLSVNANFCYDAFYALGIVTSFERFMQGYRPEADKESIFRSMCQAVGGDTTQYKQDAAALLAIAKDVSEEQLLASFKQDAADSANQALWEKIESIAQNDQFKYSRLFAIGIYTFLGEVNSDLLEAGDRQGALLSAISSVLDLPEEKLKKDLDLYRSNLEKMSQVLEVIEDALEAERQRREKTQKADRATDSVGTEDQTTLSESEPEEAVEPSSEA